MGSIGFIVMTAMLGAGAAYGLANKGKPRPGLTSGKKKILIACGVVLVPCLLVIALAVVYPPHPQP
jgi:hypothetical protein